MKILAFAITRILGGCNRLNLLLWRCGGGEAIWRAWDGLLAYLSETPLQQTLRTHLSDYP